ncbi:MAG: hypothetical protein DDT19_00766 [Syntrophomonadaceae bacterium]|nr:hypothetical protein [Bacillota bacterium]
MRKMDKKEIKKILTDLERMSESDRPLTPEGYLDVDALNQMPEVIRAKDRLREIGIQHQDNLTTAGFVAAGMVLKF